MRTFDRKLEEMSGQVLQWQKQHQGDLRMLAAKEEQLRAFQEEMAALKDSLLADEREVGALRCPSLPGPRQRSHDPRCRAGPDPGALQMKEQRT